MLKRLGKTREMHFYDIEQIYFLYNADLHTLISTVIYFKKKLYQLNAWGSFVVD